MRNSYEVSETERVRTKYNMSELVMVVNFSGLGLGMQSASEIVFGAGQEGVQRCHHLQLHRPSAAMATRRLGRGLVGVFAVHDTISNVSQRCGA